MADDTPKKDSIPKDWAALMGVYKDKYAFAQSMGGDQKLDKRRDAGLLNARERIERLVDPDSFIEIGALVGNQEHNGLPAAPADALIGGNAKINGRPVIVGSEDFTVQGGSIGIGTHAKRMRLAQLARQEKVPLIMLLDGAGERATNAIQRYPYAPNDLQALASLSGLVPTVAVVIGSSAGHGALTGLLMDFIIMVEGGALFSAGPPLVEAALGEKVTKEELGGATLHTRFSGVAHNYADSEDDAIQMVKEYLQHFPQNAWERSPRKAASPDNDQQPRSLDNILNLIPSNPQQPYDIIPVIKHITDNGACFEFQPDYGKPIVTAFAHIGGKAIAIIANQPIQLAGSITKTAAEKAAHFIEIAAAFHFPVLFLTDNPGIMSGSGAEKEGTLRAAAKMYAAQAKIQSPKLHVTLRKAYGFGSSLMAMNPFDNQTMTLGFPGVSLGGMPAIGGAEAANLESDQQQLMQEAESSGAWTAGDNLGYDDIIDPRELRNKLLAALELSTGRDAESPTPVTSTSITP